MSDKMLFTPIRIGSCEIRNRIVMAPMLMGFGRFDGKPTEKMLDYYEARAKGGTGLIITEITRVNDRTGAAAFAQLSVSSDDHIAPLCVRRRAHRPTPLASPSGGGAPVRTLGRRGSNRPFRRGGHPLSRFATAPPQGGAKALRRGDAQTNTVCHPP